MALTFPIINYDELQFPVALDQFQHIKLFSNNRQLLISPRKVVILKGSLFSKELKYDEDIVTATYTHFINDVSDTTNFPDEVLAVCLKRSINIYYPDGRSYIVNLPFQLSKALPFESGLILQRDPKSVIISSHTNLPTPTSTSSPILTLVDPIDEFRIVSTTSTSVISPHEEIMTFPPNTRSGQISKFSLCTTFNSHDGTINVYHVRTSTRTTVKFDSNNKRLHSQRNRKYGAINTTRILEEDIPPPLDSSQNLVVSGINMEKKRTSTLLSDVSTIGRMASDFPQDFSMSQESNFNQHYKKDMILSRIDSFGSRLSKEDIRVFNIVFEEKEGIVLVNKSRKECCVFIYQNSTTNRHSQLYKVSCLDCIPLLSSSSQFDGLLVLLSADGKCLNIVNPFLDTISTNQLQDTTIHELICSCDEKVVIRTDQGKVMHIKLILKPSSDLVANCLTCFQYLSGSKINQTIWMLWRSAYVSNKDEWDSFVIALLSLIYPFKQQQEQTVDYLHNEITKLLPQAQYLSQSSNLNYSLSDLIPYIVLSLHLLREEVRLNVTRKSSLNKLNILLSQLTTWMGWTESWTSYYGIKPETIDPTTRFLSVLILNTPPNLLESLTSLFSNKIVRYLTFSQLVEETDKVDAQITPRTHYILKLFEILVSNQYGPAAIVDLMCEFGITPCDLDTFPVAVCIPLKEALSMSQENPAFEWTTNALELIGRRDLNMLLTNPSGGSNFSGRSRDIEVRDINTLLSGVFDSHEGVSPWDGQSEADRIGITKLIFDSDRRYFEITTLLHQTKTQTATLHESPGISEYDLVLLQRELAVIVALRTLTIPLGRAALFYGGRHPLITEKFPIPKFNLNTLITPTMTNIIHSDDNIPVQISEWGNFHNGVSSGLSISKDAKGISGSWIIFNKPPELNAQHAGFLLGLGLNGHLKKLEEWHIYNYLGPKHPLTSVGLLLGMSASLKGSMDNKLTKVLSVHAVALLPQGANDLNVPIMVQAAGLIGIGLLYLETQHRRMSEILLSQLTSSVFQNDVEQIHEGYRLSAGIALGFVNLGKGGDLRGLNDTHVVDKLVSLAVSMKDYQPVQELNKSCCGAILALGFIYIKTENREIANKLKVPETDQLLDYIRSDMLLLRCVAKNIILWQGIGNSIFWVESEIPKVVAEKYSTFTELDSDMLCYFNILAGTCMSIAVKYASSHDITARDTILHYLDEMMELSSIKHANDNTNNYDQKIAYNSAVNIQNLLAMCVAVVMAGSGDLEVFRRLRVLHNDTNKHMGYGGYMAINCGLGLLFLGGGQYAFDTNCNFAIACLITAIYPIFPSETNEYEVHLQALRHFWALAISPRCFIVRDVKTRKPCKIPIVVTMKDHKVEERISPCLLPNVEDILTIETKSDDHFSVKVDFGLKSKYLEVFKKSFTLYVYKRSNYQLLNPTVRSLLQHEHHDIESETVINQDIEHLLNCKIFQDNIHPYERKLWLHESNSGNEDDVEVIDSTGLNIFNIIDNKLEMMRMASSPESVEDLWNLRLLFAYGDRLLQDELHYIPVEFIEKLKERLWNR
ncbi:Negative regulator of mitosis [Spathaspora sp. JA1]|nr:Negative regulator of mitosis [Spathaspora sp. JA1]